MRWDIFTEWIMFTFFRQILRSAVFVAGIIFRSISIFGSVVRDGDVWRKRLNHDLQLLWELKYRKK